MPRIRTIKPQHVNDKKLTEISLQAHLFWVLSWCFSDDSGIIENDPLLLRSQIFPRRTDIRVEQVEQWIDQLIKARFVVPFTFKGEGYLIHRTFSVHQKIDRPQPSKIPIEVIRGLFDECSSNDQPCKVMYGKGEESKGVVEPPAENKENFLKNSNLFRQPKIPELEEVHRVFLQNGGNFEMAKKFFEVNDATGWFYKGSPITNFASQVPSYISSWNENNKKNGSSKINGNGHGQSAGAITLAHKLAKNIKDSNT
jgi:hypothetical protein